jgi:cobalt-zinc-cadmium efflux system outer membrane protein
LSLIEAERMMLAKNRDLQAARRAQEAVRADSITADRAPNPNLTVQTANINPRFGVGAGGFREKTVDTTVRIDQLIERGEKRELRVQTARTLEAAVDADYLDMLRQQRLVLRAAYYDLGLAQEKAVILADTAALFERSLGAAERRLNAGDISGADLSRMRVDALRAMNDARAAESDRSRAQVALAYLIGAEASAHALRAGDQWPNATTPPGGFDYGLIERRPDVRAAKERVAAAESARELARRLRTRDVSVGAQFEHWPQNEINQQGTGNSFGIAISVPLFVRHAYEGEIRRAEVDLDAARDGLERVRAQAIGELSRAWADLHSASERVRRYNDSLIGEARRAADAAEFAYKNGALGIMDLLDARRILRATQIDAVTAQADYGKALASWEAGIATKED